MRANAINIELEIFRSERLVSTLRKGREQKRVFNLLDFATFSAYEVLVVGGCCVDNFFKLRGFVAEAVTSHDTCLSEKFYCVIDCSSADAEVALGHRSTNSLDIEVLVHL